MIGTQPRKRWAPKKEYLVVVELVQVGCDCFAIPFELSLGECNQFCVIRNECTFHGDHANVSLTTIFQQNETTFVGGVENGMGQQMLQIVSLAKSTEAMFNSLIGGQVVGLLCDQFAEDVESLLVAQAFHERKNIQHVLLPS